MVSHFFTLLTLLTTYQHVSASIYDCWDPEKLNRMTFKLNNQDASDPNLDKFSKMVRCLMKEQTNEPGGLGSVNWNQWQSVANTGNFAPSWNNKPEWTRPGSPGSNTNWNQPQQPQQPQQGQPRPGVHPEDWDGPRRDNIPPPPQQPPDWAKKPDRRRNRGHRRKPGDDQLMGPQPQPEMPQQPSVGPPPSMQQVPIDGQWGDAAVVVDKEEAAAISLNRQYGYAIMACAVVILAVLMVAAIFCCSSSNSTMSQPATQGIVQVAAPADTFSIYSYNNQKQPVVGTDTLRSSATLGDSLRTETLRSTQSRASPQYRVSDIDPEFVQRFRESQHY